MKKPALLFVSLSVLLLGFLEPPAESISGGTWSVTPSGTEVQIAYGSGSNFPQYGAIHLNSSYFRLNYGPTSGWGTSVVLLPAFWSGGIYYQGAPITATWQVLDPDLVFSITGTIASLKVFSEVRLSPPVENTISAQVTTTTQGSVPLDDRPGEAFKPVMLSSMHISPMIWDTQAAFADCRTFTIPESGWIIQPPLVTNIFGLQGGTSEWKTNAPTIRVALDQRMQVTGWVTQSNNPNDDNVGFWAAANEFLPSWSFKVIALAASGPNIYCSYLPGVFKNHDPRLRNLYPLVIP